jgi:hypothetical protein
MSDYITGSINSICRITGAGFYALSGISLPRAGFIDFNYFYSNPEYVEFTIPENVTYGKANFYFITGNSLSDPLYVSGFNFYPKPRLDSIRPNSQEAGEYVAITGAALSGVTYVSFNNITGTDIFYNEASGGLMVKVPSGYTTGPIIVSGFNNSGIVKSISDFNFLGRIFLSGFSSNLVYEGDLITISGRNFNLSFFDESYFPVSFISNSNGTETGYITAPFTGSNNRISGVVPINSSKGNISITSKDNISFTSKSELNILKQPVVFANLGYYLSSGNNTSIIGNNLSNATGIVLSGYNFRKPKNIFNSGVATKNLGPFGKSMLFSGDNYLLVESFPGSDFQFNSNDFTVEFWINPTATMPTRVDLFNEMATNGFYFYKNSTTWRLYANGADRVTIPESNTPVNTWTKVSISKIGTTTNGRAINSSSSYSNDYIGAYSISAGSGLFIGRMNTGLESSLGKNSFVGYLADFRIVNGSGLYSSSVSPTTGISLSDENNTVLLLKSEYSKFNIESGRNNLKEIAYISGNIDDFNYGAKVQSFNINSFTKNSLGSLINYTNSTSPGAYDLIIKNTGNRNFTFKNFQVTTDSAVITNISYPENYISESIDVYGFNFYPDSSLPLITTGIYSGISSGITTGNQFIFPESHDYLYYQSLYRPQNTSVVFNSIQLSNSNSKYDGKTFLFSGVSNPYISFAITGTTAPLSYNNPFTFELDFKPLSSSSVDKFLVSAQSGFNIFVNSDILYLSGIFSETDFSIFSGKINTNAWNRISIFKQNENNSPSGFALLNGSPLSLFNTGTSNFNFTSDFALVPTLFSDSISYPTNIYIGRNISGTVLNYWSGYIDEIRVMHDSAYKDRFYLPIKRARSNIDTDVLLHANVGFFDDNIRDFGYFKSIVSNILPDRNGKFNFSNRFSYFSGSDNQKFTLLQSPTITGIYPLVLKQGELATGYGSDLYYIDNITVGGFKASSFNVSGLGSEFSQLVSFRVPDLAQSGDSLVLNSKYYNYTYPTGLIIDSGVLKIDGFFPTTGIAGSLISVTGKFLNTVSSLQLARQDGNYQFISTFANQSLSGLSFNIPDVPDLSNGNIIFNGNVTVISNDILTIVNPIISNIIPLSAYFDENIILSGSNLSGLDFYGVGYNDDLIKFPLLSSTSGTGVVLKVPREIKKSAFTFFPSGTSGVSGYINGFSPSFIPSTTITGSDLSTYRTQDPIIITGINAHQFQTRDLYISGYNLLTNKTGQYLISQNLTTINDYTLTGSGFYQPYTGYVILSGRLNVASSSLNSIPDIDLLISGSDILGLNSDSLSDNYLNLDGYIGSGQIFFQRNSFDADRLFKTITVYPPSIFVYPLNTLSGSSLSLITLTGNNLNYVTGIRFSGVGKLSVGGTGASAAIASVQTGYSTGIVLDINTTSISSNLIYKDYSKIQFYPPSVAGKNIHGKDVEDIRPVTGMFYLMTYLNELYPITGNFSYLPILSLDDAFLNNRLTYTLDGINLVSGWDGSIISFKGQGVRYLTGVDFYSESNSVVLENYPSTFNTNKKKAIIGFFNTAGAQVTGYQIFDRGNGYTVEAIRITGYGGGPGVKDPLIASGIVSFLPPYVGQITGVNLISQDVVGYSPANRFSSGSINLVVESPLSGFIVKEPNGLLFTGNDYSTQSTDGSKYTASYIVSATFPVDNDFVVGEKLNFKLKSPSSLFSSSELPFLVIQNPNNYARITDIVLTGSYVGNKKFKINYSQFYVNQEADFDLLDAQIKTSILYPTGYTKKQFALTSFKPSKNGKFIDIEFSSNIPPTGDYVIASDNEDSKYLKFRIETINSESSLFKGLGSSSSATTNFAGRFASYGSYEAPS